MCRVYHARAMKFRALSLLALALLPAMGLWFGVSAVAPQIAKEWHLDEGTTAWLTLSGQLGFAAGDGRRPPPTPAPGTLHPPPPAPRACLPRGSPSPPALAAS